MPIDQNRLQNDQAYRAELRRQGYVVGSEGGKVYAEAGASTPSGGDGGSPASVPFNPQASTAAMNAAGYLDTPEGRAAYVAGTKPPPGAVYAAQPTQPVVQGANLNAAQLLLNQAQQAAYQAYLTARLNLDTDQEAFTKAQGAFQNKINEAQLTGTYNGAPTMAAQEQQFQHGLSQAALTGTYNGQETLAAQAQKQKTTLDYLNLVSGLKGPQDYGAYLRTLGSTPGGLRDLVAAAAGQYVPATGASTGVAPTPASLGGLINAATTGASGGTSYGDYMKTTSGLPLPNQIAPAAYNAFTDSQKKLLLDAYQAQGWNINDVQDLYRQSLPTYGTAPGTTGVVRR